MTRSVLLALRDALASAWAPVLGERTARERAGNTTQSWAYDVPDCGIVAHLDAELRRSRLECYGAHDLSDADIDRLVGAGLRAVVACCVEHSGEDRSDLLEAIGSVARAALARGYWADGRLHYVDVDPESERDAAATVDRKPSDLHVDFHVTTVNSTGADGEVRS